MNTKIKKVIDSEFPNFKEFRGIQEQVINNVVENGSTLVIAPTGSGKSLMYWVSARVLGGVCVVISPLISLIDEQTQKLRDFGFNVLSFHSSKTTSEKKNDMQALKSFANGEVAPDYIFVSPERIATDGFLEFCFRQQKEKIKLFVIDEVHCISQWGFDFRPFYKRIPNFLDTVFDINWPKLLAMTATINPKELDDVCCDLRIPRKSVIRDLNKPLRHDINIFVEKYVNEEEKSARLFDLLKEHQGEKALVYLYRKYNKNGVEDLTNKAIELGIKATFFHGDLDSKKRQEILDDFKKGKTEVVFATNAFGMGIDIRDIRVVIHFMLPESIEQYYQEIGRGGRDELGVKAYILYTNKNIQIRKQYFIDNGYLSEKEIIAEFDKQFQGECGLKSLQFFEEDKFSSIFNNLLNCKSIEFIAKGVSSFDSFSDVKNNSLKQYFDSVKKKSTINILNKNKLDIKDLFDLVFKSLLNDEIQSQKSVPKCIFLNVNGEELSSNQLNQIVEELDSRKQYKHNLLDYFTYLLDGFEDSRHFHQDIGCYLGVPKHYLEKIYVTENGISVRSKSEVIIANILYRSGLDFKYEEPLKYSDSRHIEPDFTIYHNGKKYYWEHLGLLGRADYDESWRHKKEIYKDLGLTDLLFTTEENMYLSNIANNIVATIKTK